MKHFFYRVLCGFLIGVGAVLPGVSGGVMAVAMGFYEGMISAISGFFKNIRRNALFLLPIALGGGIGVLLTSIGLSFLFERFEAEVLALFTGLVLGSMPALFLIARDGAPRVKWSWILAALFGLAVILIFAYLERVVPSNETGILPWWGALTVGAILALGTVIPGISASFILIYLGFYAPFLAAVSGLNIPILLLAAAGFAAIALLLIRGVDKMLKKHHILSYFAIIGFTVGSVLLVLPSILDAFSWLCPLALVIGFAASYFTERYKQKRRAARLQDAPKMPDTQKPSA